MNYSRPALRTYLLCLTLFLAAIPFVAVDKVISDQLHARMVPWDRFLQFVTSLGDGKFLIPLCIAFWLLARCLPARDYRWPQLAVGSVLFAGLSVQLLKMAFGRPRPYLEGDSRFSGLNFSSFHWLKTQADFHSFPSGHTTITFAVAWVLIQARPSFFSRALILLYTILVALSRVALGKHFFADILSAAGLGIASAQFVIDFFPILFVSSRMKTKTPIKNQT